MGHITVNLQTTSPIFQAGVKLRNFLRARPAPIDSRKEEKLKYKIRQKLVEGKCKKCKPTFYMRQARDSQEPFFDNMNHILWFLEPENS